MHHKEKNITIEYHKVMWDKWTKTTITCEVQHKRLKIGIKYHIFYKMNIEHHKANILCILLLLYILDMFYWYIIFFNVALFSVQCILSCTVWKNEYTDHHKYMHGGHRAPQSVKVEHKAPQGVKVWHSAPQGEKVWHMTPHCVTTGHRAMHWMTEGIIQNMIEEYKAPQGVLSEHRAPQPVVCENRAPQSEHNHSKLCKVKQNECRLSAV